MCILCIASRNSLKLLRIRNIVVKIAFEIVLICLGGGGYEFSVWGGGFSSSFFSVKFIEFDFLVISLNLIFCY